MNRTFYKKGQRIDAITTAGEDFTEYEEFGIRAQVFDVGKPYTIPVITADKPVTGKLDLFLQHLKQELDKPFVFTTVINPGLARHLTKQGISFRLEA